MQRLLSYGIYFPLTFLCATFSQAAPIACQQELVKQHYKYQYTNPDSAAYFLQQLRVAAKGNVDELLRVHNIASWYYVNRQVNKDSALLHAQQAIALVDQTSDKVAAAAALTKMGFIYSNRREYKKAIHWLDRSIVYKSTLGGKTDLSFSYNLLGNVYRKLNIFDKGILNYQLALEHATKPNAQALTYKNLGKLYTRQEKYLQAAKMLMKAIELYGKRKKKNTKPIIQCKVHLAAAYLQMDQLEDAVRLLRVCENYFIKKEKRENIIKTHRLLADAYFKMEEVKLAEKYALKSYERAVEVKAANGKLETAKLLVSIYDAQRNYKEALAYQKEVKLLQDSTSYHEIRQELINENLIEQIRKNESELIILRQEKTIHRLFVLSLSLIGILLGLLTYWLYQRKVKVLSLRIKKETESKASISEALAVQKKQTRQLETELQAHIRLLSQQMEQGVSTAETKRAIENLYAHRLLTEEDWSDFKLLFAQVHPAFLDQLKQKATKLSNTDVKVVSLMRLNLENSEIGKMLAISPESIRKAKYRLRQKLGFANNQELQSFVFSL